MMFDHLDSAPKDGLLLWDTEILPVLEAEEVDQQIVDVVKGEYDRVDENGDGLDFEEFTELVMALFDDEEAEEAEGETSGLEDMYKSVDTNKDGVLDKQEV